MRRRHPVLLSAVVATAMAIGISLAPVASQAADTPEGAVNALIDTLLAKQFDAISGLVCEAQRDAAIAEFDLASQFGPTAQQVVDAMTLSVDDRAVTKLTEEGDDATVQLGGTLRLAFDETAIRAWVVSQLEAAGQPTDDASVEAIMVNIRASAAEGQALDDVVQVRRENGQWLVCDDFDDRPDDLCALLPVEEINPLSPVAFEVPAPSRDTCLYTATVDGLYTAPLTISLSYYESDLDEARTTFPEATDSTVADRPALVVPADGVIVDVGERTLHVDAGGMTVHGVDPVAFATSLAELLIPRLPQ
jgi:hypothetical protein